MWRWLETLGSLDLFLPSTNADRTHHTCKRPWRFNNDSQSPPSKNLWSDGKTQTSKYQLCAMIGEA